MTRQSMRPRYVRGWLLGVGALAVVTASAYYATLLMPTVEWVDNGEGGIASDDPAPLLFAVAAIVGGFFIAFGWRNLRHFGVYLPVTLAAGAAFGGWYHSIEVFDVPATGLIAWLILSGLFAVGGLAATVVSGWRLGRMYGLPHRLRPGKELARARAHHWEPADGGRATVAFHDRNGVRHDVETPLPRHLEFRPLIAIHDPDRPADPDRLRLGTVVVADEHRFDQWRDLKDELPADDDNELWRDLHDSDPGVDLDYRLNRLVERRADGELTAEEFTAAKWRALTDHVTRHDEDSLTP